jgi:hypothetical protein
MRHQAAIHSNPPVTMPTRYPSPARPTTCSAEILEASSDMPINGHRRSRPARKYSASVCFLARRAQYRAHHERQTDDDNGRIEDA